MFLTSFEVMVSKRYLGSPILECSVCLLFLGGRFKFFQKSSFCSKAWIWASWLCWNILEQCEKMGTNKKSKQESSSGSVVLILFVSSSKNYPTSHSPFKSWCTEGEISRILQNRSQWAGHSTSQYVVLLIGKFIVNNMLQFSSVQFFQRHCAESELFKWRGGGGFNFCWSHNSKLAHTKHEKHTLQNLMNRHLRTNLTTSILEL